MLNKVSIWKVNRKADGMTIRVATIEQGERKESMCKGCSAPCCKGILQPVMNAEEFLSRAFPMEFIPVPDWLREHIGNKADFLAVLRVTDRGCPFHNSIINSCTIWPNCPKSCKAYDCREDTRDSIRFFAAERMAKWQGR